MEATRALRILVVDDNEANRAFATAAMEDEGYEVLSASNGISALKLFSTFQPDCVLLDLKMPEKDGLATCRELRALPGGPGVAVVLVTAVRTADIFDHAMSAGADDFVAKPVLPNELVGRVRVAVRARAIRSSVFELREMIAEVDQLKRQVSGLADPSNLLGTIDRLNDHATRMLSLIPDAAEPA
jgi:DNA-binding response OmpR family regulator